ncbi:DUF3015 family protein [Desulfoluna butyratoxydans]|uniref:DUF3015 domain-containing protein n=1 Tax=Desulfoluna butyratoxydans TaxID=231438 RepID=A0A4U8YIT2_9BACT|nr:DUF3015 family protein [Desulfoluna butyratoxydans]VFQ43257.1 protein of unknown function duf3015 [Desulfoluna butyratoxydans]
MKKCIVALGALLLVAGTSYASTVSENCGCGLGKELIGEKTGLAWNILGTSLNGTSGNQTFGISSGTLGCDKPESFVSNERMDAFVADNMDSLAVDIASGNGESLDALMEIAQVSGSEKAAACQALQANFDTIYPTVDVEHAAVSQSIRGVLAQI